MTFSFVLCTIAAMTSFWPRQFSRVSRVRAQWFVLSSFNQWVAKSKLVTCTCSFPCALTYSVQSRIDKSNNTRPAFSFFREARVKGGVITWSLRWISPTVKGSQSAYTAYITKPLKQARLITIISTGRAIHIALERKHVEHVVVVFRSTDI